jgi:AraC-like DNA-binding protein
VLVFFDNQVWLDFCAAHAGQVATLQPRAGASRSYIEFEKDAWMTHYIQSLVLTLRQGKRPSVAMKQLKMQELLLHLLETQPTRLLSFSHAQTISAVELRIRKVMEANLEHHLGIEELAFLCHLSVSSFKRHFKKIYGGSPMEWYHQQRMKLAGQLLHHEKPGDIWHKLGFETHTGFTKSFRKYYGVSPSEYAGRLNRQEEELNPAD